MEKMIQSCRQEAVKRIFSDCGMTEILLFRGGRDRWDFWLFGEENLPVLPPFQRNSLYLLKPDGTAVCYSEVEPHPTAPEQYPVVSAEAFSELSGGQTIGTVNGAYMKKSTRDLLLASCPGIKTVDVTDRFREMRLNKEESDLAMLRSAAQCYDRAFSILPLLLRPGRLESEIAVDLRCRIAQIGGTCEDLGVNTMVRLLSAPQDAPETKERVDWPGRRLEPGDRIDLSVNGWVLPGCGAALGRSFVLGEASSQTRADWDVAFHAQEEAARLAVPGRSLDQIEAEVFRTVLEPKGYRLTGDSWMYGIGASCAEPPRDTDGTKECPLREGMTLVIAPRVHCSGRNPVCCMDMFEVTAGGARRMNHFGQELKELEIG